MVLVSVDDHVVEPPDMFERHLPGRWRDIAPRVERRDDGSDVWVYDGNEIPNIGLNAVAGRPPEEYGMEPTSFDEMRSGCYDIGDRLRDMDANGVLGSMCFPSFPNLCGQLFSRSSDLEAGLAVLQAYNDWHIDEWCGAAPGRFIPLMLPPIWDPKLDGGRGPAVRGQGVPRRLVLREPLEAEAAELPRRALGPVLAGVRRRGDASSACTSARRRAW